MDIELDAIQRDIWARINQEAKTRGIKLDIGDAYTLGSSIKEILHPRVEELIKKARRDELKKLAADLNDVPHDKFYQYTWGDALGVVRNRLAELGETK